MSPKRTMTPANTTLTMVMSLMRMLSEGPARGHHELVARIDYRTDRTHVGIRNALVISQERTVKVCEQNFHLSLI